MLFGIPIPSWIGAVVSQLHSLLLRLLLFSIFRTSKPESRHVPPLNPQLASRSLRVKEEILSLPLDATGSTPPPSPSDLIFSPVCSADFTPLPRLPSRNCQALSSLGPQPALCQNNLFSDGHGRAPSGTFNIFTQGQLSGGSSSTANCSLSHGTLPAPLLGILFLLCTHRPLTYDPSHLPGLIKCRQCQGLLTPFSLLHPVQTAWCIVSAQGMYQMPASPDPPAPQCRTAGGACNKACSEQRQQ